MSESSLATRLPCLCPLPCIQGSVRCAGTQVCPLTISSTNEILLQVSFLLCPISYLYILNCVVPFQIYKFISIKSFFKAAIDFQAIGVPAIAVPLSLSSSTSLCQSWRQIPGKSQRDGGLDPIATEMLFAASILPAWH